MGNVYFMQNSATALSIHLARVVMSFVTNAIALDISSRLRGNSNRKSQDNNGRYSKFVLVAISI